MSILVVGSIALDSIETPFGKVEEVLGGSAVFFSVAASFFAKIDLVGVVGKDFPEEHLQLLQQRDVDLEGLQREEGKTFRWVGHYGYDLNEAQTIDTQLNVFSHFTPTIPDKYRRSELVFLANIDPTLQLSVLEQVHRPQVVACDTMNFWIENKLDALKETIKWTDILLINEAEAREIMVPSCLRITRFSPPPPILLKIRSTPPERAIPLPAGLWDTLLTPTTSKRAESARQLSSEASWHPLRWSGSALTGCVPLPSRR